ncbi:MAG: hypothetical protein M5U34_29075 [Chloroflexi bacterium]|nr:hypothetical protein [Chloroflexota bacterium]
MWTPDVYEVRQRRYCLHAGEGKVGGFTALLRIFLIAFPSTGDGWIVAMAILPT